MWGTVFENGSASLEPFFYGNSTAYFDGVDRGYTGYLGDLNTESAKTIQGLSYDPITGTYIPYSDIIYIVSGTCTVKFVL